MTTALHDLKPWTEDYFRDGYLASLPPAHYTSTAQYQVQEIVRLLLLPPGGKLLDVPCGDGRLTVPLAQQGYDVVAVDHHPGYLQRANRALGQAGVCAQLIEDDMYHLRKVTELFSGAVCYGSALGYLSEQHDLDLFTRVATCLKPGGRFVIETDGYEWLMGQAPMHHWLANSNGWYALGRFLERNVSAGRVRMEHQFFNLQVGTHETAIVDCLVYPLSTLTRLLNMAGFDVLAAENGAGAPYTSTSPRMVVVAQKPEIMEVIEGEV